MDKKSAHIRRAAHCTSYDERARCNSFSYSPHSTSYLCTSCAPNGSEVLAAASTVEKAIREQVKYTGNKDAAAAVGKAVAERALAKGVQAVAFDRSGFKYHGRVKL